MKIYVIADENNDCNKLKQAINKYMKKYSITGKIVKSKEPAVFYQEISALRVTDEDLFFLAIAFKAPFTGVDLAQRLMQRYLGVKVIFVANDIQGVLPAINCNCRPLAYLLNGETASEATLEATLLYAEKLLQKEVTLPPKDGLYLQPGLEENPIPYQEITYVSCVKGQRNQLAIQIGNSQKIIKASISSLQSELQLAGFSKSLRSYIINLRKIDRISRVQRIIYFDDGQSVSLGIKSIDKIRKEFAASQEVSDC